MTEKSIRCDEQRLRAMLEDRMNALELTQLYRHMETCSFCQKLAEELAASQEEWQIAGNALKTSVEDQTFRDFRLREVKSLEARGWDPALALRLLEPPAHPEMLGRLGRYEIERLIGVGGMGIVFKAHDSELARPVAIKILAPFLASNGTARKRFGREARAAAAVVHPHVVPIYNVETNRELPYIVMRYVGGDSLQARVDREGPLRVSEILRVGLQIAAGLQAAHQQGLVHRDIKPSNILLEDENVERALLTDFGLALAADDAQVTRTGLIAGTPRYMSPEQARGETVDEKSDLFSLGSVLYTLCTGRPPFLAQSAVAVLRQIIDDRPQPIRELNPEIPLWLVGIISRLMSKAKEERFASAGDVCETLRACLTHVEQPDRFPLPSQLQKVPDRAAKSGHLSGFLAGGLALALGVVALAIAALSSGEIGLPERDSNASFGLRAHSDRAPDRADSVGRETVGGESSTDFEILGFGYVREANRILFENEPVVEMGLKNREYLPLWARKYQLAEEIDPVSFRAMSREYARDRNHVYYKIEYAEIFWLVELAEARPNTFEVISGNLAKDDFIVWWCGQPHPGLEPQTLKVVRPDFVWKDKDSVWYHRKQIDGADPATFQHVGEDYYRDAKNVYWGCEVIHAADPVTFRVLEPGLPYGRDRDSVWERNLMLDQVDADSCEILHMRLIKDKNGVFADGLPVETENPGQFRKLADLYGHTTGLFTDNQYGYVHSLGLLFRVELLNDELVVTQRIVDWSQEPPQITGEAVARLTAGGWNELRAPEGYQVQFETILRIYKSHFEMAKQILSQIENSKG